MIKVEFSGESSAEVLKLIGDFVKAPNTTGTTVKNEVGKEEKPAKETKGEIGDEVIREKVKSSEVPVEDAKALIKKFGYEAIPKIPQKKRAEFLELLAEFGEMTPKKRKEYLAEGEGDVNDL